MQKRYIFGVDMGGTTIKNGLFTVDGKLLEQWEIPTRVIENGSHILDDITETIMKKAATNNIKIDDVEGIGIGIPGPVGEDGTVYCCVNVGWGIFNIADELYKRTGVCVRADNDANIATLGELWKGAGSGCSNIVMITIGTGVGGGIVTNGKILHGYKGVAGEIGHMIVVDNETVKCSCGRCGCLQQYSSATGIVKGAKQMLAEGNADSVLRKCENLTAKDVCNAAIFGDKIGMQVMDRACWLLGKALAQISCIVTPEVFVIGGGLSKAGMFLVDSIQKYYQEYVFHASSDVGFVLAELGNDAGIYGAAKLFIE